MPDISDLLTRRVFRLSAQVVIEEFEDGALLFHSEDHHLLELNPTAQQIVALTNGERTVSRVAAILAQRFEIEEADVLNDIVALYEQLSAQRLIEIVNIKDTNNG